MHVSTSSVHQVHCCMDSEQVAPKQGPEADTSMDIKQVVPAHEHELESR